VTIGTKADAAWDGVSANPTLMAVAKYLALNSTGPVPGQLVGTVVRIGDTGMLLWDSGTSAYVRAYGDVTGGTWIQGPAATGSAAAGHPLLAGGRAATQSPTAVADGQAVPIQLSLGGKQIVMPYSIKQNMLRGSASATDTAAHTIIAAQGTGKYIHVTAVQCHRTDTGTTPSYVTLNDTEGTGAGTTIALPPSGGSNPVFPTPLEIAANTALTFTPHDALTTVLCNAQGYIPD
jgi:hypothetical protein